MTTADTPRERQELKLLYVNPCLRRHSATKVLPVGLGYVMTYLNGRGYSNFDLLDVDINDYDDEYVERYVRDGRYDVILLGSIVTHYKWVKWFVRMAREHQPGAKIVVG